MLSLLVVDDDPAIPLIVRRVLSVPGYEVRSASTGQDALRTLAEHKPDVILLDIQLPDITGLELFHEIRRVDGTIPVIFITASGTSQSAIEAIKLGAFDYLTKPLDVAVVKGLLDRAFSIRRLMHVTVAMGDAVPEDAAADVLLGNSPPMQEVYKAIGRVAPQDVTVLIRGESGTGKELVARAIYQHSKRSDAPFLAINCAAIPEALLESELFGHERGAFTGADRQRIGKFEQCSGGTLFLDEIGDMPPMLQTKMLRVLQEQQFERVGGNATISTSVRIIAATHQDLERRIAEGRFRADLYYRLNVFTINLPPLRKRPDDIPQLVAHYLARFRSELGSRVERIAPESLETLQRNAWPGNVRELQASLKQAVLRAAAPVLMPEDLPATLREATPDVQAALELLTGASLDVEAFIRSRLEAGSEDLYAEFLERMERILVSEVLNHTEGNQVQAARILGIARNSLRKKIKNLGITIDRAVVLNDGDDEEN